MSERVGGGRSASGGTALVRLALFALLVALPAAACGQGPSVEASLAPLTATVGGRLTLRLRLEHAEGTSVVFPDVPSAVAPLVVLSSATAGPFEEDGRVVEERYYVMAAFETGALGIPQLPFEYGAASGDSGVAWTDSLSFTIESVIPDTLPEEERGPRDIKPPVELPRRVWPFILTAALVAAAALAAWYFRKWWLSRTRPVTDETPVEPVVPRRAAHLVALQRLDALAADDPAGRGDVTRFYVRVTEIVRLYLRDRFAVDAIDMTTTELAPAMDGARIERAEIEWAVRFLSHADLAKFAKHTPTAERAHEDLREARDFVERTRFLGEDVGDEPPAGDGPGLGADERAGDVPGLDADERARRPEAEADETAGEDEDQVEEGEA